MDLKQVIGIRGHPPLALFALHVCGPLVIQYQKRDNERSIKQRTTQVHWTVAVQNTCRSMEPLDLIQCIMKTDSHCVRNSR